MPKYFAHFQFFSGVPGDLSYLVDVAVVGQSGEDAVELPQPLVDEDRPLGFRQRQQCGLVEEHRIHLVQLDKISLTPNVIFTTFFLLFSLDRTLFYPEVKLYGLTREPALGNPCTQSYFTEFFSRLNVEKVVAVAI